MNVLILAAGERRVFENLSDYPLCLLEFRSLPLLAIQMKKWVGISTTFTWVFKKEDVQKFHLKKIVLQFDPTANVIAIEGDTAGAACTALLATELIDNEEPLVIMNGDELIDIDFREPLNFFSNRGYSAGALVFDSVHPRYSYVKLDEEDLVVQAAEKDPISRIATAGFYWYNQGKDFVCAAKTMIKKQYVHHVPFYICPVFNELILAGKKIGVYLIDKSNYHPVKSQQQLRELDTAFGEKV